MKKLMAAMLSFVMAMMLLAGCASASTDNTFSDPMQQVSLSNDEMLTSLNNATAALQENINKTDDSAKVELVVADDGSCSVYASGSNTERQELCKADSIKAMFEIYYENNWIDKDGNVSSAGWFATGGEYNETFVCGNTRACNDMRAAVFWVWETDDPRGRGSVSGSRHFSAAAG